MNTLTATEYDQLSVAEITFRNWMLRGEVPTGEIAEWYSCSRSMARKIAESYARRGAAADGCEDCGHPLVSYISSGFAPLCHMKKISDGTFVSCCPTETEGN